MEDLTVTADFSRHYDAAAQARSRLEVALPANVSAGVIGGPYTVQVSLSEDGRRQYGVLTMRQRATVGSLLPDGSVSLLVQRVSACTATAATAAAAEPSARAYR